MSGFDGLGAVVTGGACGIGRATAAPPAERGARAAGTALAADGGARGPRLRTERR